MIGWGIMLLIIGIGSFIMPAMGIQFRLIQIFGEGNEWVAGVVFSLGGIALIAAGFFTGKNDGGE